jgi:hypothetical protein
MNLPKCFSPGLFILAIIVVVTSLNRLKAQPAGETAIRVLLEKQVKNWNGGNLEAFMQGYWTSDSLMFIGKNGPTYGYNSTLENYRKNYPDTAAMGRLHFDLLELKRLCTEYYFVAGKWSLQRSKGDLQGHFTLLFRKIKNRWVIISDHSS